jgi:hypothetical protein
LGGSAHERELRPDTPHLHFAISELDAARQWWSGRPIDRYLVFK